jgi:hypothetical protein
MIEWAGRTDEAFGLAARIERAGRTDEAFGLAARIAKLFCRRGPYVVRISSDDVGDFGGRMIDG